MRRMKGEWKNRKQHSLGMPMQKLGLYYKDSHINSSAGRELGLEPGAVVDLKKKAGRVILLDHIGDRLGICIGGGGINIDTRQQVIKDCIFADSTGARGLLERGLTRGGAWRKEWLS